MPHPLCKTPRRTPRFVAGLVAFSLAMSTFGAPARADDADVVKALGGLLTLYVIGKAVSDQNKSQKAPAKTVPSPGSDPHWPRDGGRDDHAARTWDIPASCLFSVQERTAQHWGERQRTVVDARCLTESRRSAHPLPASCEDRLRSDRGLRRVYDLGCLNNFGYAVRYERPRH